MKEIISKGGPLALKNADIHYYPGLIENEQAQTLFRRLLSETPWQSDRIQVFGKWYDQPRLTALYGEAGKPYTYSGIQMQPHPFTPTLAALKQKTEQLAEHSFSSCLLNLYRNGEDSNGWHADDENELGKEPIIGSISLGSERYFHLRPKNDHRDTYKLLLQSGSLLLMKGKTQHFWQHQIPKSKTVKEARINLTFRLIQAEDQSKMVLST